MLCAWYSLNERLKPETHAPIAVAAAKDLAKRYYANAGKKYREGEEALIACTFGLIRPDGAELEIMMCRPDHIDLKFQYANPSPFWIFRLLAPKLVKERTIKSPDILASWLEGFYTTPPTIFARHLRDK